MAKTFLFIFSFVLFTILPNSITRRELKNCYKQALEDYKEKKYSESIPNLKKCLEFREDPYFRIYLGHSLLETIPLDTPSREDDLFTRKQKMDSIKSKYLDSAQYLLNGILNLETIGKKQGLGVYYYYLGISYYFAEEPNKSIYYLQKSLQLDSKLKNKIQRILFFIHTELDHDQEAKKYLDSFSPNQN
jgi:tetratricopeptide (TPR) repeat protein